MHTLATQALVVAQALGGHILAYDVLPVAAGHARRLVTALQQGDVPTCVTQWVALHDDTVTTLTATCAVTQYTRLALVLEPDVVSGCAAEPPRRARSRPRPPR